MRLLALDLTRAASRVPTQFVSWGIWPLGFNRDVAAKELTMKKCNHQHQNATCSAVPADVARNTGKYNIAASAGITRMVYEQTHQSSREA